MSIELHLCCRRKLCVFVINYSPVSMGTLKPLSGVIKLTLPIETPVIHVQGGFKVPMETGRNLEHTTERHERGFKVPMETGSISIHFFSNSNQNQISPVPVSQISSLLYRKPVSNRKKTTIPRFRFVVAAFNVSAINRTFSPIYRPLINPVWSG